MKLGIIGDGKLALALATLVARQERAVALYAPSKTRRDELIADRASPSVLPELETLPELVTVCQSLDELAEGSELLLLTSGPEFVALLDQIGGSIHGGHQIVHTAHQLHGSGLTTTSQLIRERTCCLQVGALAGPIHVGDLLDGKPNAAVVGSAFPHLIQTTRSLISAKNLRIYSRSDTLGVEYAAAMTQPIAVLAGLAESMGMGAGTFSLLIVRALIELRRLGRELGANDEAFTGLAGLGRLLDSARRGEEHYDMGKVLAAGLDEARATEVYPSVRSVVSAMADYAQLKGLSMPLVEALHAVLSGSASPVEALSALLETAARAEE
ncbi:MAG: hypothetical protein KC561_07200 [Myxococcales bacterium]|nr:hypothetical protein [Myxococcales bacterium]